MLMISVIVPVYNVENYLKQCITSILSQTYRNFELILINDGSSDSSGEICDQYARLDSRIRVIHTPNQGVARARNLGISKAKAEFICFIDSDDWVAPYYLNDFLVHNSSLVIQNMKDDAERICFKEIEDSSFDVNNFNDLFVKMRILNFGSPYCKLYLKKIIVDNNIYFPTFLSFGEDTIFFMRYLQHIQNVVLVNKANYFYRNTGLESLSKKTHRPFMLLQFYYFYYFYYSKLLTKYNISDKSYINQEITLLFKRVILSFSNMYKLKYTKRERVNLIKRIRRYAPLGIKQKVGLLNRCLYIVIFHFNILLFDFLLKIIYRIK